ncbi:MAG: hypothetical protein AAF206_09965 [Bacteroidota bacterium]
MDDNFSWKNASQLERDSFYHQLPVIANSPYQTHIRFVNYRHRIDFFSNDNIHFKGSLINRAIQSRFNKEKRIVWQKITLDDSLSSRLARQLIASGQALISSDTLKKDWQFLGFTDCGDVTYFFKLGTFHNEQTLFCPWSVSDTALFHGLILQNLDTLEQALRLQEHFERFCSLLPIGHAYSTGTITSMYKLTKKEARKWQKDKPRRAYFERIKDTLDGHLKEFVSQQRVESSGLYCLATYELYFDKNGKLKRIRTASGDKPNLWEGFGFYLQESRDIRRCRKKIQKIFQNFELKALNLEYGFERELTVDGDGQISLHWLRDEDRWNRHPTR